MLLMLVLVLVLVLLVVEQASTSVLAPRTLQTSQTAARATLRPQVQLPGLRRWQLVPCVAVLRR
jgi:hypothetical protein